MQDENARPYTNGTVIHSGPVQIVASEYRDASKEKSPDALKQETKEPSPEPREASPEPREATPELKETAPEPREPTPEPVKEETKEFSPERKVPTPEPKEPTPEPKELTPEPKEPTPEPKEPSEDEVEEDPTDQLIKLTQKIEQKTDTLAKLTGDFLGEEKEWMTTPELEKKTSQLLEEALKESSPEQEESEEHDNGTVKVS